MAVLQLIRGIIRVASAAKSVKSTAKIVKGPTNHAQVHQEVKDAWIQARRARKTPPLGAEKPVLATDLNHIIQGTTDAGEVSSIFRNAWQTAKLTK